MPQREDAYYELVVNHPITHWDAPTFILRPEVDMVVSEEVSRDFIRRIDRQGPGGDQETLKATFHLPVLGANARIADIGCGTGRQTAVLAERFDCKIDAVDLFPEMLDGLMCRCMQRGVADKVDPIKASMDALPFKPETYDLIWAEGSIFIIGYEKGLRYWRQFLKPGGFVVVSECSWLGDKRPQNMSWILDNLPEIDTIDNKNRQMQKAGYEPYAHFTLPEHCWTDNYYAHMPKAMDAFLTDHPDNPSAQIFVERMKEEMAWFPQRNWRKAACAQSWHSPPLPPCLTQAQSERRAGGAGLQLVRQAGK